MPDVRIMQRYAFVAVALVALSWRACTVRATPAAAMACCCCCWHWRWRRGRAPELDSDLPAGDPGMRAGLEFIAFRFRRRRGLPMIFRGAGDCTERAWTFLGLSIAANWSPVCFADRAFGALVALRRTQR